MPIYEYVCKPCNVQVELRQPFHADKFIKCPKCSKKIQRIISKIGGFIFKGTGFYATDYKRDGK